MQILERKPKPKVLIATLKAGDCFFFESTLFMVIEGSDKHINPDFREHTMTVRVSNGKTHAFGHGVCTNDVVSCSVTVES